MELASKEITVNSPMTAMIDQIMFAHFTRKVHAPLVAVAEMNMLKFVGTAPNQQPLQHVYPPILLS
jgi:hypothetical protein